MTTMGTKFLITLLATYLTGGSLMEFTELDKFIGLDPINKFVFYTVFGLAVVTGLIKFWIDQKLRKDKNDIEIKKRELDLEKEKLELYERKKMIDDHYKKENQ